MHHAVIIGEVEFDLIQTVNEHKDLIHPREALELIEEEIQMRKDLRAHEQDRFAVTHRPQQFE